MVDVASTPPDFLGYIVSALFGGGGVVSLLFARQKTLSATVDSRIKLILEDHQKTRERDRQTIKELSNKIDELEAEIADLRVQLGLRAKLT